MPYHVSARPRAAADRSRWQSGITAPSHGGNRALAPRRFTGPAPLAFDQIRAQAAGNRAGPAASTGRRRKASEPGPSPPAPSVDRHVRFATADTRPHRVLQARGLAGVTRASRLLRLPPLAGPPLAHRPGRPAGPASPAERWRSSRLRVGDASFRSRLFVEAGATNPATSEEVSGGGSRGPGHRDGRVVGASITAADLPAAARPLTQAARLTSGSRA